MVAGNTMTSSIFGVAAFAQPALGRAHLAGETGMLELYNEVYAAPLFSMAVIALLLFMAGAILIGSAVAASRLLPRWSGWVFAISAVVFVLSNFLMPVGQTVGSVLLFAATVAIAAGPAHMGA
jgi:hypothetical protein